MKLRPDHAGGQLVRLVGAAALTTPALAMPAVAEDKRDLAVILLPDSGASNYTELRILSPGGGLVRTIVGRPSNNLGFPSWSPDEKTLAYSENGQVLLQPVAGGTEHSLVAGRR